MSVDGQDGQGDRVWNLVVVEDDDHLRALLSLTLQYEASLKVVGTAATAREAFERVEEVQPDLVVLDHLLGGSVTGLHIAHVLRGTHPETRIVLCSSVDEVIDLRNDDVDAVVRKMEIGSLADVARRVLEEPRESSSPTSR
jgi:DNA-binding NarL/FixJ family response regulator